MVFDYVPELNPDRRFLPGVPLRDLSEDDLRDLPPWVVESVDVCPFYKRRAKAKAAERDDVPVAAATAKGGKS